MPVLAAQFVDKHWLVVNDFALPIAKIVRSTNVVPSHVIVVLQFALVDVFAIKQTIGKAENNTDIRLQVAIALRLCKIPHRPVRFQVLDALGLPFDDLVNKLPECVLTGKNAELIVHLSILRQTNDGVSSITLVLLVNMSFAVRYVHLRKHRLKVRVNNEKRHNYKLLVRKLKRRPKLRENVDVRNIVLACAQLLVRIKRSLRSKATEHLLQKK